MRTIHRLVSLGLIVLASQGATAQPSTVILVRHAERADAPGNTDPELSEAGKQRALDLAAALGSARVTSIITTQYKRTQLTAQPLLEATGLTPIVVRAGGGASGHVDSVAAVVKRRPAGDVVLVVGHSNTIPAIIAALGGPKLPDLCDTQYGSLFVVEYPASGPPRFIRAMYGTADPPGAEDCSRPRR